MAVESTVVPQYLFRAGCYNPASDWTVAFWFKVASGTFQAPYTYGNGITHTNPYLAFFVNSLALRFEVSDGITPHVTSNTTLTTDKWYFISVTYNATTHDIKLYLGDGTTAVALLDTINFDISTLTFVSTNEYAAGDGDTGFGANVGYIKVWQRVLTIVELETERPEILAVSETNLLADTPLLRNVLDYAHSANWTNSGTAFVDPQSYVLDDADSQFFDNQDEGTVFAILELNPDTNEWFVEYFVSNDPTNDNRNVIIEADTDITVLILNTKRSKYSGLYYLVPDKHNDTLLDNDTTPVDVAIPDPFVDTAMVGDE
jgi:hypothetical protein